MEIRTTARRPMVGTRAAAIREKARIIEYGFSLEFDRNFQLTTTGGSGQQQQREFEQLQRMRISPGAAMQE